MIQKLLCLFLLLKCAQARYGFVPKFYGQDSAIIVDTDKPLPPHNNVALNYPAKLRLPPPFPMWQNFPRYHIIPPPPPGQFLAINTWAKNQRKPIVTAPPAPTTTISLISTTTRSSSTTSTATPTTPMPTTIIPRLPTTTPLPLLKPSKFDIDTVPFVTDDEFPKELLDIAQKKLGLKSLDEIPSISELGQLLGTNSPQETLSYIKQLTANEQGVALMRAYIESTDYTDSSGDLNGKQDDAEDYDDDDEEGDGAEDNKNDIEEDSSVKAVDEGLVVISDDNSNDDYETDVDDKRQDPVEIKVISAYQKPRKTPKIINKLKDLSATKPGFFESIANFMHLNNLWHHKGEEETLKQTEDKANENTSSELSFSRVTFLGKKFENSNVAQHAEETVEKTENHVPTPISDDSVEKSGNHVPTLVRDPIPYNYPVPIRPSTTTTTAPPGPTTSSTIADAFPSTSVHLNTPKMFVPHVQQLARVTNMSPQKIEDYLATKPKLMALANKVSRFPIGYDRNSPVEAQVIKAVQRAIEQDDDLKKLLNSTATLK